MKWDEFGNSETIPMWVADMDFETAPCIIKALQKRIEHGCFGYTHIPESFYKSIVWWFQHRHNWTLSDNEIICTTGVMPAISAIIKAMTETGDKILIQTPVYNCFFSVIRNSGRIVEENPLRRTQTKENELFFSIDWDDFEQKCSDPQVKIFLLCNPHNPTGRVWTKAELSRMGDICLKHNVLIISDEIHCEFIMPTSRSEEAESMTGEKEVSFTPFASISENYAQNCATCTSPSKAFNIAGLQTACIVVKNSNIRSKIKQSVIKSGTDEVNPLGIVALQAAYTSEGEMWLDDLNKYLYGNYLAAKKIFDENAPQCPVTALEGTYLLWIDISATKINSEQVAAKIFEEENVFITHGTLYGESAGEGYLRINIATRRSLMEEGIRKIAHWLKTTINLNQ